MNNSHPPYRAAIIGLGAIAQGYGSPECAAPYCHAGGLLHCDRVDFAAAADPFPAAREGFVEKWGASFPDINLFEDVETMLASERFDVVAVCVRGPHHYEVMKRVLQSRPRVVFLEKPPTCSLTEMDELVGLAREAGTTITVSYSRHWSPRVLLMEKLVREGLIGDVQSVVGYCGGAVLSFASHTTDLIHQFATATDADNKALRVRARGYVPTDNPHAQNIKEGFEVEPRLQHLSIDYSNGVLGMQVGAHGAAGPFYAEVFGKKGRVKVGMYTEPQAFDGEGKPLEIQGLSELEDKGPFTEAYRQIATFLDGGAKPDCSDEAFVHVNEIGFGAVESLLSDGETVELPNQERTRRIWANE
ncbi:MAG TPA: Gfo/Idh/MocA family oxidoreductase [Abditibacteriaceae bacterium]|jgi:predicted dehydrogenase